MKYLLSIVFVGIVLAFLIPVIISGPDDSINHDVDSINLIIRQKDSVIMVLDSLSKIDSVKIGKIQKQIIVIEESYEEKINTIADLDIDSSIIFFSKWLSSKSSN